MDLSSQIDTIKILLLYILHSLLLEIPEKQLRAWDKVISRFIWNCQRPKVKFETIQFGETQTGYFIAFTRVLRAKKKNGKYLKGQGKFINCSGIVM